MLEVSSLARARAARASPSSPSVVAPHGSWLCGSSLIAGWASSLKFGLNEVVHMDKTKGIWIVTAVAGVLAFAGCSHFETNKAQAWTLSASPNVPAAEGKVRVSPTSNGNQELELTVENLAPADKAFPGMTNYVVWVIPQGGAPAQNVGILNVGESLKGKVKATTPYKTFDVLVTAESQDHPAEPSGNRVMSASVYTPS